MNKPVQHPYLDNRKQYSSVLENIEANTKSWRMMTFIMSIIALFSVAGVIYIGSQSKIKPVVVEIDGYGTPMRLYQVNEAANVTDDRIVKATLAQVIKAVRSVYIDGTVQKREMDNMIFFFERGQPGFATVQEYITDPANNPFKRAKKELVNVNINNVIKLTDNSWQVEWTEITRDRIGQTIGRDVFKAAITISYTDEISENAVYVNPTGLLIRDITWSQKVN